MAAQKVLTEEGARRKVAKAIVESASNDKSPQTSYGLTQRQYIFATEYIKSQNATTAAVIAFDCANDNSAAVVGFECLRKPNVAYYIEAERKRLAEQNQRNLNSVLAKMDDAFNVSKATQNGSAMASAAFNEAKLLGLVVDQVKQVDSMEAGALLDSVIDTMLPILVQRMLARLDSGEALPLDALAPLARFLATCP